MASRIARTVQRSTLVRRSSEWGDSSIPPNSSIGAFGSTVVGGWAAISIVLSCVKALFDDFLIPQFMAYTGDPMGARRPLPEQPLIVTDPFGPDIPVGLGMAQLVISRAMRGNYYCAIADTDPLGYATLLTILDPDRADAIRDPRNPVTGVKVLKVNNATGGQEILQPDEFIHGQGLTMPGQLNGIDILTAQRYAIQAVGAVEQFGADFFRSGGSPSGVLQVPGNMSRKNLAIMGRQWDAAHTGGGKAHRPAILTNNATWQQLSVSPENAQFLETRRFNREEICGLFGVPLQRVQAIVENASQGGARGIESIDEGYVAHTLLAIGSSIEDVWNRLIPNGAKPTFTGFDWRQFLRVSAMQRAQIAASHRLGGIRTRDEIRAEEGWGPLPDGKGSDPDEPLNSNKGPSDAPIAMPEAAPGEPDTMPAPTEGP